MLFLSDIKSYCKDILLHYYLVTWFDVMAGIVFPLKVTSLYPKTNYYIIISNIKKRVPMYCSADDGDGCLKCTAVSRKVVG